MVLEDPLLQWGHLFISSYKHMTIVLSRAYLALVVAGAILVAAVLYTGNLALAGTGEEKVELCHKDKNTLTVGFPAVEAHLAHGDSLGACEVDDDDGGDDGDDGGDGGDDTPDGPQ